MNGTAKCAKPTNGDFEQRAVELLPHQPVALPDERGGLGGTNVTFALTNSTAGAYSVLSSTDLVNWLYLGPATPRYEFTDTNAPAIPQRYYRLRWP